MVRLRELTWLIAVSAAAGFGTASAAPAAEPSGTAIAVNPAAQADGGAGFRVLVNDGAIYSGDKIVTGPSGQAQIKFRDETKLVVGPNSALTVDAFIYSGNSAQKVSIDALKGGFRFITGISKKDAYSISTPTAVIAVRGTEFDFNVDRLDGETEVVMFGGTTLICPKILAGGVPNTQHEHCAVANRVCNMTIVPPGGEDVAEFKAGVQRNALINRDFRYIRNQNRLNPEFRVDLVGCGSAANFLNMPPAAPAGGGGPTQPPTASPPPSTGDGPIGGDTE